MFPKENDFGEHHFVVMKHLIGKSEIYKNEKLGGIYLSFLEIMNFVKLVLEHTLEFGFIFLRPGPTRCPRLSRASIKLVIPIRCWNRQTFNSCLSRL